MTHGASVKCGKKQHVEWQEGTPQVRPINKSEATVSWDYLTKIKNTKVLSDVKSRKIQTRSKRREL